jgi:hypothetical protein
VFERIIVAGLLYLSAVGVSASAGRGDLARWLYRKAFWG